MYRLPITPSPLLVACAVVILAALGWMKLGGAAPRLVAAADESDLKPAFAARVAALEERLSTAPAAHDLRLELARLLNDGHRHLEAIAHFEQYVAERPADRQGWLDLASVYGALGRWDDAERTSLALLEHHPGDAAATYNLGAIAANRGNIDEARAWWGTLVESGSADPLAKQAEASLARLEALGSGAPPAADRPNMGDLPPGHPPIGAGGSRASTYLQSRPPAAGR